MLPSSGYFRGIACPAHTRGSCNRPYCHFRHDMKGFPERNVSSSSSLSSQAAMPTPAKEAANAEDDGKQEELEYQDIPKDVPECSSASLSSATAASSGSGEQLQPEPHASQQQEPAITTGEMPKSELLQQLMSEALKKVLAENPILASTVDASAIRIGIDPITHKSPEINKTKKQFYARPPDTPNYNPTPIKELKKRKLSVDGVNSLGYNPSGTKFTNLAETEGNEEEGEGSAMGKFSSDDSEEEEEKNDDFDLLEEVLAEHSKNNKLKVKKKRVKELGKLQYHLSNADKKIVESTVMIADAKKLTDKEVKRFEVPQPESVNKVVTDAPYFLPPSPVFTSSSDGFEAFNSRASYQEEEENSMPEKCSDKPLPHSEPTTTNSHPVSEKETIPKQTPDPTKSGSEPVSENKARKSSGHTHLPQLLSDAPKLTRPNVRNWTPLVRNSIPVPDVQKNNDQLDEMLQLMDGSDSSNKRKLKECENHTSNQKDSESARPRKKYKVDLNKEIESLTNPLIDQLKETVTPDKDSTSDQSVASDTQNSGKKQSTKEPSVPEESCLEPKEKQAAEKTSTKDSGNKKSHEGEAEREKNRTRESDAETESSHSDSSSHGEDSEDDSKYRRARHKKRRKRGRSSSSDSDYSRHRRKKRKRGQKHRHKRNKKSRKRRDSTSSLSDQSKDSEEEKEKEEEEESNDEEENEKKDEEEEEEEESNDEKENEKEDEEEEKEKENKNKVNSESEDKEDSDDEVEHHKKSKRHKKKHKYYKKAKHKRTKHKAKRKRKRSKSYSRSRSLSGSQDSSRSRSRSRSSSKHRKKKSRSRHKSRNLSDGEERESNKERRSRSSSRNSSSYNKSRESKEKDSVPGKHVESSKSKDKSLDKEGRKGNREDGKSRDRSTSKSRQQSVADDDGNNKKSSLEEISIPMPVDPSKIKVEKNALIPDLSKVKIEKDDSVSDKSITQDNVIVNKKDNDKTQEEKSKGQGESGQSKAVEKVHERRRSSTEEKSKRRRSRERKDSTESTSDKAAQRQQSCESKISDGEVSQQRKKIEEKRRSSTDKNKKIPLISSQPSEMSMFDLVLASTEKPKPKTLKEISIFDSISNTNTNDSESEASGEKVAHHDAKKSKSTSQKPKESSIKYSNLINSEQESSSNNKTNKTSKPEKPSHADSHHKHDKSESKSSHSSSKSKSSSSHHHNSNSSSSNSSSHKRTTSTSSRGSSSSKHHSSTTTPTTPTTSITTPSSSSTKNSESSSSSSSKSKKASDPSSSKGEKDSTRHSSTLGRKHSSSSNSSNKLLDSSSNSRRRSSSSSKHKEDKDSHVEPARISEGSETTKKRKISVEEDSPGGISDDDHFSIGGDSPLPDLSVLDEIPQDDWEQMLSGSDSISAAQEPLEDCDDMDHDDPKVLEECMQLYNEFQQDSNPLENQVLPKKMKVSSEDKEPATVPNKQRVARSSSTGNLIIKKPSGSRHQRNNPMQRMVERYQKLKEQLKLKEQQLHHLQGGSSAVSSSSSSRTSIAAASSSTHHNPPSQSTIGKTKKRIAHVPNVSSLLHAQEKIFSSTPSVSRNKLSPKVANAGGVIPETTATTVAKGGKRVAHTPRLGALARPIIQPEFGSLVPQNIRQRYLNALIEECKKFCSEKEAFNIAAAEERVCYQRAPSRMVYLNLVVNAVKRLRTQKEAGEAAQELLDEDPQLAEKMCIEEPSSSSNKPSSSLSPSSSPSSSRSHPVNPNHVQLSHTTVLSSGGIRGSWSIEKSKKTLNSSEEVLKGKTFYKHLLKYVLTEEQLEENGYPCPDPEEKGKAVVKKVDTRKKISPSALERYCDRCSVLYTVDKWGFPKSSAPCVYHWGRPYKKRKYGTFETTYSCCGGEQGSGGCNQATTHVSQNYNPKSLRGYVRTISKDTSSSNKEVYALDCEMCYTTEGNELTRITVIGCSGDVVYEQLVKPENPILDYNTRFSGITESDMEDVKLTIRDVQAALLARFSDKTILIGHSLESDLHALKIIHTTVVDTSVVFPHKMGAPYKRALKNLAAEYLKRIIQDNVAGHDSAEDAVACLHLMQWKVKEDLKGFSK